MLEKLLEYYRKADESTKKKILGCIFAEKLVFRLRVQGEELRLNEAFYDFQAAKLHARRTKSVSVRVIEGFSRWYINSGWGTAMIKFNYVYFNYLVRMLFAIEIGIINDLEFNEVLDNMRNLKHSFLFDFHPGLIKRYFVQLMQKVDEIERKVEIRISYKNLLKVVN